jgi:RHS repeat-associated protein
MSASPSFRKHGLALAAASFLYLVPGPVVQAIESSGDGWHCVSTDPATLNCDVVVSGTSGGLGDWPDYLFLDSWGGAVGSGFMFPNGGGGGRGNSKTDTDNKKQSKDPCDKSQSNSIQANPVDVSTGQKIESDLDFQTEGLLPLTLDRQYRSYNTRDGLFGRYWESNFDFSLEVSGSDLVVRMPGKGIFRFVPDAAPNTWKPDAIGLFASVTKLGNGSYTVVLKGDSVQSYDAAGKVTAVKNQRGTGYDFSYDVSGKLNRVTATSGKYIQFGWTGTQLTSVTDPAGGVLTYSYFADRFGAGKNLLQKVNYPGTGRSKVEYLYDNAGFPGALTGKKLDSARFSWFTYDSEGRATSSSHSRSASNDQIENYTFAYTQSGSTLTVMETNPLGKQSSFQFDGGILTAVTGLPSSSCPASLYTQTRDALGMPNVVTDFNDNQVDYDYDTTGRLTRTTRGAGSASPQVETSTFDATVPTRVLSDTLQGDHSTAYTYDGYGRVLTATTKNLSSNGVLNQARVTTYSYLDYANGMLSSVTIDGPLPGTGDAVTQSFSAAGELLTVSDSLGVIATYSNYNGFGQPGRMVQRPGVTFDYTFDAYGRQLTTKRTVGASNSTQSVEYDKRGRAIKIAYPDGRVDTFGYDNGNRLTDRTRKETNTDYQPAPDETVLQSSVFAYSYNDNSNRILETAQRRRIVVKSIGGGGFGGQTFETTVTTTENMNTPWTYDELGRPKSRGGDYGQNFRFGFDESVYLTSRTDSLGRTSAYQYDALNRLKVFTDAKGGVTTYGYDAGGRLSSVTDPRGLVTRYFFDGFDQLWRLESPNAGVSTFAYDAYGRRTGETPAGLASVSYSYDSLGRVTTKQAGTATQSFSYDSCSNGIGRFCAVTDASGSTSVSYTPTGMLAVQVNVAAGNTFTTSYAYDKYDRLTQLTFPDGKTAAYDYLDGKLRSITATPNGVSQVVADSIQYEPFGPLMGLRYGNGISRANDYDQNGRLVSIKSVDIASGANVQGADFGLNANDQATSVTSVRGASFNRTLGFDELGRLTSAAAGTGITESFTYDALGNRKTHATTGQASKTLDYGAGDDRLSSTNQGRIWTYNANGNANGFIGADAVAVGLSYDAFGRVVSSSRNSLTTAYLVNALGQRISKVGPNGTQRFVYSINGQLLAEYKDVGGWTDYVRVGDMLLGAIRNNALYYVHTDQVGRPEVLTNAAKAPVWAATNNVFDRTVTLDQIGGLNLGFPGQYFDQETGLWQNYFRDYDASIGRYIQADPLGLVAGPNMYAYAGNDPTSSIDPFGLEGPEFALLGGGVIDKLPERRGPDYIGIEISRGGITTGKTLSRSGNVFTSVGGTGPHGISLKTPFGNFGINIHVGYMLGCPKSGSEVDDYLKEWSQNVSAYRGVGGGVSWNGGGASVEFGAGIGGGSGSMSNSVQTGTTEYGWHGDQ